MKPAYLIIAILSSFLFVSCKDGCLCGSKDELNDTEYTIAYKLVDSSWDTIKKQLPKETTFWIGSTNEGTYALYYKTPSGNAKSLRTAAINYKIVGTRMVIDTTAKKVELLDKDSI